jgi:TetR/AcrR family transcriptional regulator
MPKAKPVSKSRDADLTKAAILDAAEVEFGRRGLQGARTENIADGANVTRAMIHYYYDSKEKLYQAVLERALESRMRIAVETDVHSGPPLLLLESYVRSVLLDMYKRPNVPLVLMFEGVQNEGRFYKQIAINSAHVPLRAILERGVREGVFRDMDVAQVCVNIVGMCSFYILCRFNLQHWFDADVLSSELFDRHIEETVKMVIAGVKRH